MTTVLTFLAIAAFRSWTLYRFDVKNAFLHGDLKEEVYRHLPQGLTCAFDGEVARLRRSLYSLKRPPQV